VPRSKHVSKILTPPHLTQPPLLSSPTVALSSPLWPSFTVANDSPLKGATLFRARRSTVDNFKSGLEVVWKQVFPDSETLSWKEKNGGVADDLIIIGQLSNISLSNAWTQLINDLAYRVELLLEQGSVSTLRGLLENGPLHDSDDVRFPIFRRMATFSAKLRTLQRTFGCQHYACHRDEYFVLYYSS
jgi:hypothetical protein